MLGRRVDSRDSCEDDVERWSEQEQGVTVFGDIIGKSGDGWVHWSRRRGQRSSEGIELSGMRRVAGVVMLWSMACERRRRGRRSRSSALRRDAIAFQPSTHEDAY